MSAGGSLSPEDPPAHEVVAQAIALCAGGGQAWGYGELADAVLAALGIDPATPVPSIARALTIAAEYDAACESQGLPLGTAVERFVLHHRSNAGLAAYMNGQLDERALRAVGSVPVPPALEGQ